MRKYILKKIVFPGEENREKFREILERHCKSKTPLLDFSDLIKDTELILTEHLKKKLIRRLKKI